MRQLIKFISKIGGPRASRFAVTALRLMLRVARPLVTRTVHRCTVFVMHLATLVLAHLLAQEVAGHLFANAVA